MDRRSMFAAIAVGMATLCGRRTPATKTVGYLRADIRRELELIKAKERQIAAAIARIKGDEV